LANILKQEQISFSMFNLVEHVPCVIWGCIELNWHTMPSVVIYFVHNKYVALDRIWLVTMQSIMKI
jgi:hypothetical protein